MFIYIVINVYLYFTKDHLSIYKVHSGSNAEDNVVTGIILREEKIVHSIYEGYMSYFQKDGARVAKNASVYSVDDSNEVYEVITSGEIPVVISNQHNDEIKYDINKLHNALSKDDFSYVYEFKEEAVSTIQDLINTTVMDSYSRRWKNMEYKISMQSVILMKAELFPIPWILWKQLRRAWLPRIFLRKMVMKNRICVPGIILASIPRFINWLPQTNGQ